jgi:hypothetical protein
MSAVVQLFHPKVTGGFLSVRSFSTTTVNQEEQEETRKR